MQGNEHKFISNLEALQYQQNKYEQNTKLLLGIFCQQSRKAFNKNENLKKVLDETE